VYQEVAAQTSFMTLQVADPHAHVQRLVSVVKMATLLGGLLPKSSVLLCVCLLRAKGPLQRIFIKQCFLFTAGSVSRVKWFTTGSNNSLKDV
jgi:hypothetical protein